MEDNLPNSDFSQYATSTAQEVQEYLTKYLPKADSDILGKFNESLRYSTLSGGKRIRPLLTITVATGLNGNKAQALRGACALELIHTYSLIHDDLPAMDNDDYRRGKLTNHKVFGEPIAILAGDALLTLAFQWFSSLDELGVNDKDIVKIIKLVSKSAGIRGMVGGQALDLANDNMNTDLESINKIHQMKTGMLIKAAVQIGAIIGQASKHDYDKLSDFADKIGLLFQIVDDILDVSGDISTLGKSPGSDQKLGKATYPALLGMDKTLCLAKETYDISINLLNELSVKIDRLSKIADYIYNRKK